MCSVETMDVERCTTEKNDQYLGPDDDDLDANEVFIFEHPFKYVELVVETAATAEVSKNLCK